MSRTLSAVVATVVLALASLSPQAAFAAAATPSPELQAEMVAALTAYGNDYVRVPIAEVGDSKYLKVTDVDLVGASATSLSVKFDVRLRVMQYGLVLYTVDGTARGQFRLGAVTADLGCIAAAPGETSALTVTSISIPHMSTAAQHTGVEAVLRGTYPDNLCVPIRPSVSISDTFSEECTYVSYKPAPMPAQMRFTVTLSNLSARNVSVTYATANGSATGGSDYTATSNATLTIPALSNSATLTIGLRCDEVHEGTETFFVNTVTATNATIADPQAKALLLDYAGP